MSVMTASTADYADYAAEAEVARPVLVLVPSEVTAADAQRVLSEPETSGDPCARLRLAEILYRITGWEVFGADERAYVSRLWAEDWDSPEDSAYDAEQ